MASDAAFGQFLTSMARAHEEQTRDITESGRESNSGEPATHIAHTLFLACCRCRQQKICCDSTFPECLPCQRAGATCESFDTSKNERISRRYVTRLQDRVGALQAEIDYHDEPVAQIYTEELMRPAPLIKMPQNLRFPLRQLLEQEQLSPRQFQHPPPQFQPLDERIMKYLRSSNDPSANLVAMIHSIVTPNISTGKDIRRQLTTYEAYQLAHQNIKPANFLLQNGHVFLTDFGISRDRGNATKSSTSRHDGESDGWCAPEVDEFETRNPFQVDICSLSCVRRPTDFEPRVPRNEEFESDALSVQLFTINQQAVVSQPPPHTGRPLGETMELLYTPKRQDGQQRTVVGKQASFTHVLLVRTLLSHGSSPRTRHLKLAPLGRQTLWGLPPPIDSICKDVNIEEVLQPTTDNPMVVSQRTPPLIDWNRIAEKYSDASVKALFPEDPEKQSRADDLRSEISLLTEFCKWAQSIKIDGVEVEQPVLYKEPYSILYSHLLEDLRTVGKDLLELCEPSHALWPSASWEGVLSKHKAMQPLKESPLGRGERLSPGNEFPQEISSEPCMALVLYKPHLPQQPRARPVDQSDRLEEFPSKSKDSERRAPTGLAAFVTGTDWTEPSSAGLRRRPILSTLPQGSGDTLPILPLTNGYGGTPSFSSAPQSSNRRRPYVYDSRNISPIHPRNDEEDRPPNDDHPTTSPKITPKTLGYCSTLCLVLFFIFGIFASCVQGIAVFLLIDEPSKADYVKPTWRDNDYLQMLSGSCWEALGMAYTVFIILKHISEHDDRGNWILVGLVSLICIICCVFSMSLYITSPAWSLGTAGFASLSQVAVHFLSIRIFEKTERQGKHSMLAKRRDEIDEELERYKLKCRLRRAELDTELAAYQGQHDQRRVDIDKETERYEIILSRAKQRLSIEEAETRRTETETRKRRELFLRDSRRDESDVKRRSEELSEEIIRLETRKALLEGELYNARLRNKRERLSPDSGFGSSMSDETRSTGGDSGDDRGTCGI